MGWSNLSGSTEWQPYLFSCESSGFIASFRVIIDEFLTVAANGFCLRWLPKLVAAMVCVSRGRIATAVSMALPTVTSAKLILETVMAD